MQLLLIECIMLRRTSSLQEISALDRSVHYFPAAYVSTASDLSPEKWRETPASLDTIVCGFLYRISCATLSGKTSPQHVEVI